jgi:hypothetical protein
MLAKLLRRTLFTQLGCALLVYLIPWGLYFRGVRRCRSL